MPFVGDRASETSASYETLFGYIFGTSSYSGGTATEQYYSGSQHHTYYIPTSLKSVTITGGNILYGAFYNCSSLTSINIGDSVTSIGDYYAFYNCSALTSVTIGSGITSIGSRAFYGCSALTSITIPDSVISIGEDAFGNCSALTSVTIGNGVTSIGYAAFWGCSALTSVTIGSSVTSIGVYAFRDCSALESVFYGGTADEWAEISIASGNTYPLPKNYITSATRYYYYENESDVPTDGGNYWHYGENNEILIWGKD